MEEKTEPNIVPQLAMVQAKLKVPKNQRNNFGNYNYRSAEDILEALKPLLQEAHLVLTISDEIVEVGGRVYVKANAEVMNEIAQKASCNGYAREAEDKKGMDSAQITGACSSYARKYALNGLFAIDDTKDADHFDNTATEAVIKKAEQFAKEIPQRPATAPQKKMIFDLLLKLDVAKSEQVEYLHREFNVSDNMTMQQASDIIGALKIELGEE